MQAPDDVAVMLRLHSKGWGMERIASELAVSKNTVRRYVRAGGWMPYQKRSYTRTLAGLEDWLERTFRKHRGNAAVVKQELQSVFS